MKKTINVFHGLIVFLICFPIKINVQNVLSTYRTVFPVRMKIFVNLVNRDFIFYRIRIKPQIV